MTAPDTFNRAQMEKDLIRDEGLKLQVYRCTAGKQTIGVGRNLDANGLSPAECEIIGRDLAGVIRDGISQPDAMMLLDHDIDRAAADLDKHWPWWRTMNPVRQRILLNMCFNMGAGVLQQFTRTLFAMKEQRWGDAATGMRASRWANQVGERAVRLARQMETGLP